jgi:TRAP-type uncharacterized transport system substrate-binding protein
MSVYRMIARAAAALLVVGIAGTQGVGPANATAPSPAVVNRGVVELETGPANDVSVRMASEIASIIDDGATRRVVPVVGKGPLQNLIDLKYLRGIDLAIVQTDALDYAKSQDFLPDIGSLTYVAKLYNEELHLLARPGIKSINDLAGQTVNVDVKESSTAITAYRLFGLLGIKANLANDRQPVALEKLQRGEIAAIAYVAAEPAPLFQALKAGSGLHFLNIPLTSAVTAVYAPTRLTAADYPNLVSPDQPVDTIAVSTALMAADLRGVPARNRNLTNFIDAFFTGFRELLTPGYDPKWREVNIAADLPGWTRTRAAAAWLRDNPQVATTPSLSALQALFSRFIDERRQATGGAPMSATEKNTLFQQFETWQRGHAR